MAAIKNDRDIALRASGFRLTTVGANIAATVTAGGAVASGFYRAKDDPNTTPASITLTVTKVGYVTPTYEWSYTTSLDPVNKIVIGGATSSTYVLSNSTYITQCSTGTDVTYYCKLAETAWTTSIASIALPYVKAANSLPSVSVGRIAFELVTTAADVSTLTGSGSDLRVSLSGTYIPYAASGVNTWNVSATPSNVTLGAASTVTTTVTNDTRRYADFTAVAAGNISASVTYTFQVTDAQGVVSTIVAVQSITKSVVGAAGLKSITLNMFKWSASETLPAQSSTYDWTTGILTLGTPLTSAGWSSSQGTSTATGQSLYAVTKTISVASAATSTTFSWNTADSAGAAGTIGTMGYRQDGSIGLTGITGGASRIAFVVTTSSSVPAVTGAASGDALPTNSPASMVVGKGWATTAYSGLAAGEYQYQVDGVYTKTGDTPSNIVTWGTPYLSNLKVGSLSAIAANIGTLTVANPGSISSRAYVTPGTASTAGFYLGYGGAGAYVFDIGNKSTGGKYLDWDGTNLSMVGGSISNGSTFSVTAAGVLTCSNAVVTGTIASGSGSTIWTTDGAGNMWSGNAAFGSAPFRVSAAGALTATNANITGAITASSGSITGPLSVSGIISLNGATNNTVIRTGTTTYGTAGIFLGYDTSAYKFSVKSADGTKSLLWDGAGLSISGTLTATSLLDTTLVTTVVSGAANGATALAGLTDKLSKTSANILSSETKFTSSGNIQISSGTVAVSTLGAVSGTGTGVFLTTKGIVGWNGTSNSFFIDATTGAAAFKGDISGSSGTFAGTLSGGTVSGGTVSGATITGGTLNLGSGAFTVGAGGALNIGANFAVTALGAMTATGVTVTGAINASSGSITGNLTMGAGGSITLSSTGLVKAGKTGTADTANAGFAISGAGDLYFGSASDASYLKWLSGSLSIKAASMVATTLDGTSVLGATSVSTVVTQAGNGNTANTNTSDWQSTAAPGTAPAISSATFSTSADGNVTMTVTYTYTQGSPKADSIYLYFAEGAVAITTANNCIALDPVAGTVSLVVKASQQYSLGIISARTGQGGTYFFAAMQTSVSTPYRVTASAGNYTGTINSTAASSIVNTSGVIVSGMAPGLAAAPSGTGLYMGSDRLGYYNSTAVAWKSYMDSSGNFYLGGTSGALQWSNTASTLTITGNLNATTGYFGTTGAGFTVAANQIYSGAKSAIGDVNAGVYVGTDGIALGASNVFKVTSAGALTATSATITGAITATSGFIGTAANGFTLNATYFGKTKTTLTDANAGVYVGTDGISLGASSAFKVDSNGALTATSATITGAITATSGFIGTAANGFTLNAAYFAKTKTTLTDANTGVYIGTDGISLGASSVFKVEASGALTTTNLTAVGTVKTANTVSGERIEINGSDNSIRAYNPTNVATFSLLANYGGAYFSPNTTAGYGFSVTHTGATSAVNPINFSSNATAKPTVSVSNSASGGTTVALAGVGNIAVELTGGGIKFPATPSLVTGANVLDDYVEGTFTSVVSATGWTGSGIFRYTKIGRQVMFNIALSFVNTGAHSGDISFTVPTTSPNLTIGHASSFSVFANAIATGIGHLQSWADTSGTTIYIGYINTATGSNAGDFANKITASTDIRISGSYYVA